MKTNKVYLDDSELDEFIDHLRGTSDNLETELFLWSQGEVDELTEEQKLTLENEITRCDGCGWWFDSYECEVDHRGLDMCNECLNEDE